MPSADALPEVLPTERLTVSGKAVPEVRAELREIAGARNALTVAGLWAAIVALWAAAVWLHHPLGYAALFVLMGPMFARLAILGHEAAHRLLFRNRTANDLVGRWVLDYPAFVPFDIYRRAHFAHHKDEFGPAEPDHALYAGYPVSRASWRGVRSLRVSFTKSMPTWGCRSCCRMAVLLKKVMCSWRSKAARVPS